MQKKEKDGGWAGTVVEEDGWTGACNVPAGGNKSGGGTPALQFTRQFLFYWNSLNMVGVNLLRKSSCYMI